MPDQINAAALAVAFSLAAGAAGAQPPAATYLGEVRVFAFTYCPVNWLPADGRLMKIEQYPALYALLGNYYGGDGINTFALPNLQGATPIGVIGSSPGQSATAASGDNRRFLAMPWCVAVQGTYPQKR